MRNARPAKRRGAPTPSTAGASAKKRKPAAAVKAAPTAPRLGDDGKPIERCPNTPDMFDEVTP